MSFINTPLLETVSYGFSGGPTFRTTRVELQSGIVRRNAEHSRPIYRYSAPYNAIKEADNHALIAAYNACLGPTHSFRFKDWADYQVVNQIIGVATADGEADYQIIKDYIFGPQQVTRPITKPVAGTETVTVDDVVTPATMDDLTGLVTVNALTGQTIRITCQYDVPVYFIDDDLVFSFEDWDAHSTEIGLREDISA